MANKSTETKTPVEVRAPKFTLKWDDLMWMRSLLEAKDGKPTCELKSYRQAKLEDLGLVKTEEIPWTAAQRKEHVTSADEAVRKLKSAVARKDWSDVYNLAAGLERGGNRYKADLGEYVWCAPDPKRRKVLTDCGKKLLADGQLVVKVSKVGCR